MKSKIIITKDMSMDDRLEVLRKASKKFNKKIQRNHKIKRTETSFMDKYSNGENIHAWTDGPKYLNEHYGDKVRDQNEYESYEGWN
tara:strand:- start:148 stop:405 length:258 start_codon:yes stop_codon:yes gene_type:complete